MEKVMHPYHCMFCGKQLYELQLGMLMCECGLQYIPFYSKGDELPSISCVNGTDAELLPRGGGGIMYTRFMYFEVMEGGMDAFEFSRAEELSRLPGWQIEQCKAEDDALVTWVANAEVGECFEHRLGYAVRLKDGEEKCTQ